MALLIALARERESIGAADVAFMLGLWFAFAAAIEALGRVASAPETAARTNRQATVAAAYVVLGFLFGAGAWINRGIPLHPGARRTWALDAALLAVSALLFVVLRRRASMELQGGSPRLASHPWTVAGATGLVLTAVPFLLPLLEPTLGAASLAARRPANVLLIGIDTLRADATSLFGLSARGHDTTPTLRRLAERGFAFSNAVSQAPWTLPSFASVLTGRYPHEHGALSLSSAIPDRQVLLSEVLREAGYATSGVVSHDFVGESHGFGQGFDHYDSRNALGHRAVTSKAVTDLSIAALRGRGERPFFHFAHYFDAHYEYLDHDQQTWADGYRGWLRDELDYNNLLKNRHLLESAETEWLLDLYEEEIAHVDRQIARLLDFLDSERLSGETWIIVVADHGEEFLDHGSFGHTTTLYQELLHVPLLIVPPDARAPRVVDDVVETRAIFGTVLDAVGIDLDRKARQSSLLPQAGRNGGEGPTEAGEAFSVVWLPDADLASGKRTRIAAHRDGRWKLIHDLTRERYLLFDLEVDPRERHDLVGSEPERLKAMKAVLDTWIKSQVQEAAAAKSVAMDAEEIRQLKQLGYL
jgi:arylsulfatase A-like enzyme